MPAGFRPGVKVNQGGTGYKHGRTIVLAPPKLSRTPFCVPPGGDTIHYGEETFAWDPEQGCYVGNGMRIVFWEDPAVEGAPGPVRYCAILPADWETAGLPERIPWSGWWDYSPSPAYLDPFYMGI